MIDTSKLRVGSVVRLEGKVVMSGDDSSRIAFEGSGKTALMYLDNDILQHAELVSTPVSFSAEQIAAIKSESERAFKVGAKEYLVTEEWLQSHEDKSRLE